MSTPPSPRTFPWLDVFSHSCSSKRSGVTPFAPSIGRVGAWRVIHFVKAQSSSACHAPEIAGTWGTYYARSRQLKALGTSGKALPGHLLGTLAARSSARVWCTARMRVQRQRPRPEQGACGVRKREKRPPVRTRRALKAESGSESAWSEQVGPTGRLKPLLPLPPPWASGARERRAC